MNCWSTRALAQWQAWLAAAAVTLGLGVALVATAGVASAESATESSPSTSTSVDSDSDSDTKSEQHTDADSPSSHADRDSADRRTPSSSHGDRSTRTDRDTDNQKARHFGTRAHHHDAVTSDADDSVIAATRSDTSTPKSGGGTSPGDDEATASRAPPLQLVPASHSGAEVPEPRPSRQSLLADITRQVEYTFFNRAPTIAPSTTVQTPAKQVTGYLNGQSNNGFSVTYIVTQAPKYGTLFVDQATGRYTYTPDVALVEPGITDSFTITADNGAAAQLPGLAGVVQSALHAFAQNTGLSQKDTVAAGLKITVTGTGLYGDPANSKYWAEQHFDNCALMSVAAITGQLNGLVPTDATEDAIINEAKNTPSIVVPGRMMYIEAGDVGVYPRDAAQLLRNHGFDVDYRDYSGPNDAPATYADGQLALIELEAALARGNGVLVTVNADTIRKAANPDYVADEFTRADHAVAVIAVDAVNGKVWVNDSGRTWGQGMEVPLGAFMWAWQSGDFTRAIASKPASETVALAA